MIFFSPLQMEAGMIGFGLIWACERGFTNILYECDLLQIVDALCVSLVNFSFIGKIVKDIKVLIPTATKIPLPTYVVKPM